MKISFIKTFYFILFCQLTSVVFGQHVGVNFQDIALDEAKKKAQEENKLVFIDIYTQWCGPCKEMDKKIFPQKSVGDYVNNEFISIKIDGDEEYGKYILKKYKISGFPTFLIIDSAGKERYRHAGFQDAATFIERIKKGIDPEWSIVRVKERYNEGERTPALINEYIHLLEQEGNKVQAKRVANDYFHKLSNRKKVSDENLFLYQRYTDGLNDVKGKFVYDNYRKFRKNEGAMKSLLYEWFRGELLPYYTLRGFCELNVDQLLVLKKKIAKCKLDEKQEMKDLFILADARLDCNLTTYYDLCYERIGLMQERERFTILQFIDNELEKTPQYKDQVIRILKKYQPNLHPFEAYFLKFKLWYLEGKKEYQFMAYTKGIDKGQVVIEVEGEEDQCFNFENSRFTVSLGVKDTKKAVFKLRGENEGEYISPVLLIPGEKVKVKLKVENRKLSIIEWMEGGEKSKEYFKP